MNYAEVYIDIKTHEVSQSFDYIIPHNLSSSIKPGSVVSVTFGNRKETGYVTRIKSSSSVDPGNLKYINDVAGDLSIFETTRLKLIFWMSAYFIQSVSKIISFFLPPVHEKKLTLFLKNPDKFIKQVSALPTGKEGYHAGINKTLKSTREKHREKTGYPSCHKDLYSNSKLDQIKACMRNEMFRGFLLKNMSPAEKMEVLKELCRASLHFKKTSVILSPETDDVQEIYENLNREFKGRVCIYHSDKKQSEKISAWHDVFFNRIELIVGTRSAIFLPFHSPGILILDDIHSISYKEATISRYDTRNIALRIGKLFKIPVVFISNTPPVEMFYRFESSGELEIVDVNGKEERYTGFIERRVIDLKKIDRYREDIHITNELHRAIGKEVNEGNRVLVFLNRRGYSNFLVCKKCGSIPKCPKCNISYTFHKSKNSLVCHHCSGLVEFNNRCNFCGESDFSYKGGGAEFFEKELKKRFPDTPVYRVDSDIIKAGKKDAEYMNTVRKASPAILVGTQAIKKNMDFDNITLAGVPDFDSMFQIPDFHSSERACHALYSLISWVSNRKGSRVFIQTFNTSNFVLESFVNSSYDDFYRQELENRRELFYPPFSNIINIIVSGRDPEAAREDIYRLHCEISKIGSVEFFLLGPSPAPYYKINLFYRWHIIIKTSDIMRFNVRLFKIIRNFKKNEGSKIITDVDPVWIL